MAVRPEVLQYLQAELQKGFTEEQLRPFMKSKGYHDDVLDEAFATIQQGAVPEQPQRPVSQPSAQAAAPEGGMSVLGIVAFGLALVPILVGVATRLGLVPLGAMLILAGVSFLCTLVAFITGIIALKHCKREGKRGKAFPITAIVISGLQILLYLILIASIVLLGAALFGVADTFGDAGDAMDDIVDLNTIEPTSCTGAQGLCMDPSEVNASATTCEDLGFTHLPAFDGECAPGLCCGLA